VALAKASAPREVKLGELPASYRSVLALALSPNGTRLAIGRGNQIVIQNVAATDFPVLATFEPGRDVVRALAWSQDGKLLASGSFRQLTVWEAESQKQLWSVSSNLLGAVTALRFNGTNETLIAADAATAGKGWLRIFGAGDGKRVAAWQAHDDTIHDLALSPDGAFLATAGGDRLAKLWNLGSRKEAAQFEGHAGAVLGVAFNTNATELVTVSADKQLKVWDVKTRESVVNAGGKKHGFNSVVWSADGKTVVAADEDGGLIRYSDFKRHTGAQSSETARERELGRWSEPLNAVTVNSNSTRIFAGGQDGVVYAVNGEGKLLTKLASETTLAHDANLHSQESQGRASQSSARRAAHSSIETVVASERRHGEDTAALPSAVQGRTARNVSLKNSLAHEGGSTSFAPSFVRDVLPLLAKAGCMAGACPRKAGRPKRIQALGVQLRSEIGFPSDRQGRAGPAACFRPRPRKASSC
jgi:WD40 repeat protein